MKNTTMRKTLSVILSVVLVLANVSLVAFANTTGITPEYTTSENIVGYSAALVERVDLTNVKEFSYRKNDLDGEYSVWKISTPEELVEFASTITNDQDLKGETVYLANDIDLSGIENFAPIGGWSTSSDWAKKDFKGTFDGQGYAIKGMKMIFPDTGYAPTNGYIGFFRCLGTGAIVKNLVFDENCVVSVGNQYNVSAMAMLCGAIDTDKAATTDLTTDVVTISNCYVQGQVIHGGGVAGGIVSYAKAAAVTIEHCTNAADVIPSTKVIVDGNGAEQTAAEKSAKWGSARGVGGILGIIGEGTSASASKPNKIIPVTVTITACRNTGKVYGGKAPAGGIVGDVTTAGRPLNETNGWLETSSETKHLTIDNCINNGEIGYVHDTTSAQGVGGILGLNEGNGSQHLATIKNCTNYGTIVADPQVTPETAPAKNVGALTNQISNDYVPADGEAAVIPAVLTGNTEAAGQTDATLAEALWQDLVAITTPDSGNQGGNDDGQQGGNDDGQQGGSDDGQQGGNDDGQQGGNDDNTQTQAPETNAPETKAPETNAPTTTEKSGCGATVALLPVMMVTLGAAAVALKKKED